MRTTIARPHLTNTGNHRDLALAHATKVQGIADGWVKSVPSDIAAQLARFELAAREANVQASASWIEVCSARLAERVTNRPVWIEAMLQAACSGAAITPFIDTALLNNDMSSDLIRRCLTTPAIEDWVAVLVLKHVERVSSELADDALSRIGKNPKISRSIVYGKDYSQDILARVLDHANADVGSEAAEALWHKLDEEIPQGLFQSWRSSVIRSLENDYTLSTIFRKHPAIAFDWLKQRAPVTSIYWGRYDSALNAAAKALTVEDRLRLLTMHTARSLDDDFVAMLVADDPELYGRFLTIQPGGSACVAPLRFGERQGVDVIRWSALATAALDAGVEVKFIANAVSIPDGAFSSSEKFWESRIELYDLLQKSPDRRIQEIGAAATEWARREIAQHRADERKIDLEGL